MALVWSEIRSEYIRQCELVIAVDYDGTIVEYGEHKGVKTSSISKKAVKYLNKINDLGKYRIILWTARLAGGMEEAEEEVKKAGLDFIEPDRGQFFHGDSGKVVAKFYIDDKAYINGKVPWRRIYKFLKKQNPELNIKKH